MYQLCPNLPVMRTADPTTSDIGFRITQARLKAKPNRMELAHRATRKRLTLSGITQLELAHRIGMTGEDAGADICRIERGQQEPRLSKLIQIAEALGVPLESLLPT